MIANPEIKQYKRMVAEIMSIHPKLPPNPPIIVLYRAFLNDSRRDAQNCAKLLVDSLYEQDQDVVAWPVGAGFDRDEPRVEVWFLGKKE